MTAVRKPAAPIWPKVNPAFVREMLAGHSLLGLILAAPIYLVCLTGALVVFVGDLRAWEQPRAPAISTVSPAMIDRALAHGLALAGSTKAPTMYVMMPRLAGGRATVEVYAGAGRKTAWVGPDGVTFGAFETPWTDFADALHMYLTMPATIGLVVVGLSGVALLALLISGLLAHPRVFRDAFTLRWGGAKRLQEADLHNRLSVWGLPFHLAVTLTGAFFGLSNVLAFALAAVAFKGDVIKAYAPLAGPPASAPASALPPMAAMLAQLRVTDPARQVDYIGVEQAGAAGQRITIETASPDRLARGERWFFDGAGRPLGNAGYATGSVGAQSYGAAASLHFGSFGGPLVRIAYGLLGLALSAITASGVSIWLARRRAAGRPAPRWERLWLGTTWGVPLALGLSAVLAMAGAPPTLVFWIASLAALIVAFLAPDAAVVSRAGKLCVALTLAAVAVGHWIPWGLPTEATPIIVQATLVVGAAGLATLGLRPTRAG